MSAEYLFLAFIITSNSEVQSGGYEWEKLQSAGNKLVVDWDLGDKNYFQSEWQFLNDINLLRERAAIMHTLPHSSCVCKLPSKDVLREGIKANEKYQSELMRRLILERDREELIWRALVEARDLAHLWECALTAKQNYSVFCTRHALASLRADHPNFTMPPCLPYWRMP